MSHPAIGVVLPTTGVAGTRSNVTRVAVAADELGFAHVWTFHRILYALDATNAHRFVPSQAGAWPKIFERVLDPLQVLSLVAGATERVRLGTCVINLPYYTPIVLAKELTTLDVLSDGRVELGAGIGWSLDELAAVGVAPERRGARGDEFIRCLRTIWEDEVVEFDGEWYRIPRSVIEPKPVQRPGPPVLVGGYVEASLRRAVALGDGYIAGAVPYDKLAGLLDTLHALLEAAGRDDSFRVLARVELALDEDCPTDDAAAQLEADVARYAALGVTDVFVDPNRAVAAATDQRAAGLVLDRVTSVMAAVSSLAKVGGS